MAVYFLDASAAAKRYLPEAGTDRVRAIAAAEPRLYVVRLTAVEVTSAVERRVRRGDFDRAVADLIAEFFAEHWATQYKAFPITPDLTEQAVGYVRRHGLRAYDAVQLAGAARLATFADDAVFLCADRALLAAAAAEGLAVENPGGPA